MLKLHSQIIYKGRSPEFVILPYGEYEALLKLAEDVENLHTLMTFDAKKEKHYPLALADRLADGENAIKLFRIHCGLSQAELAKQLNISKQYLSQLEKGERNGTSKLLKKIADQLSIDIELLI